MLGDQGLAMKDRRALLLNLTSSRQCDGDFYCRRLRALAVLSGDKRGLLVSLAGLKFGAIRLTIYRRWLGGLVLTGAEHRFEDDEGQIEEQHGNLLCQNNARFARAVRQSMLSES
jgi:hypothetical protein